MYFNDLEEILAVVIAIAILGGFVVSTMHDMKATIAEEKQKFKEKKEAEEKAKELINYLDTKANLIDSIVKTTKKLEKKKNNSNNV